MSTHPTERAERVTTHALTVKQATALWVVEQNEPVSVADVAGHMMVSESAARSALNRLEQRGLVGRTYTGHHRGSLFAFEVTRKGAACLARADTVLDPDVTGEDEQVCSPGTTDGAA